MCAVSIAGSALMKAETSSARPSAIADQIVGDVVPDRMQAGRPAEHAETVIVAVADHISACLDQQPDNGEVGSFGREMQRIGIVTGIANTDIRTAFQQEFDARTLVAPGCLVQRRLPLEVAATRIDQFGMRIQ
jgi:hypothetical protein